jgi:hypothetical protein
MSKSKPASGVASDRPYPWIAHLANEHLRISAVCGVGLAGRKHATEDRDRAIAEALADMGRRPAQKSIARPTKARDGRAMDQKDSDDDHGDGGKIVAFTRKLTSGDDGTRTLDPLLAKQVL